MKLLCTVAIAAGLLLTGCVMQQPRDPVPGQYKDYRQYLTFNLLNAHWKGVPADLEGKVKSCSVDVMVNSLSADDRARLDAFARAEIKISADERAALERRMRSGMDDGSWDRSMRQVCPDTVDELAAWRAKNG